MRHDDACEMLATTWHPVCRTDGCRIYLPAGGRHCHCASRLYPLCEGCRTGMHLTHADTSPEGHTCQCDLCVEEAA
jgi:hypothetical protein